MKVAKHNLGLIRCLFAQSAQRAVRAQVSADLEERKWIAPHHIGATLTYRSTPQGQYTHTLPSALFTHLWLTLESCNIQFGFQ